MRYLVAPLRTALWLTGVSSHVRPEKQNPSHSVRSSSGDQCPVVAPHVHHGPLERTTLIERVSRYSEFCIPDPQFTERGQTYAAQSGIPARVINAELDDAPEHREQRARLGSVY